MRTRLCWTLLLVAALAISTSAVLGQAPAAQQTPPALLRHNQPLSSIRLPTWCWWMWW